MTGPTQHPASNSTARKRAEAGGALEEVFAAHSWHHTATTLCACGWTAPLYTDNRFGDYCAHLAAVVRNHYANGGVL